MTTLRMSAVAGMTLLELVLVIALMAMTGVVAVMAINGGTDGLRLRGASKEIAAQLRLARTTAIVQGRTQTVSVDPAQRQWSSVDGRVHTLPSAVALRFVGASQVNAGEGKGGIAFFEDGGSSGGEIELRSRQQQVRLAVSWLTGDVTVATAVSEATP